MCKFILNFMDSACIWCYVYHCNKCPVALKHPESSATVLFQHNRFHVFFFFNKFVSFKEEVWSVAVRGAVIAPLTVINSLKTDLLFQGVNMC